MAEPVRIAVIGVSEGEVCGVRDYAAVLNDGLAAEGVEVFMHWLTRSRPSAAATRAELARWTGTLEAELRAQAPDAVLLHYSVFAYSYRGLPVFVPAVLRALRAPRAPVVTLLHEVAYPFRHRGWRAKTWALSQRLVLISVMRRSTCVVVTAEFRADWLSSRRWLPKRPTALAPVHSALPPPRAGFRDDSNRRVLGLFGYAHQGAVVSLVLDALVLLREWSVAVELVLLGAPGAASTAGEQWLSLARARGVADGVTFTGTLPMQELSDAIAACEVLLFADEGGPSSRKSSLAAALASGRPVVALDGPRRWQEPVLADALALAAPTPSALARAVRALLENADARDALGTRGRSFAQRSMSPERGARAIVGLLSA